MSEESEFLDINDDLEASFDKFMKYRDEILKALEIARSEKVIGKSFNAKLTITLDKEAKEVFESLNSNIAQILIVSQLELVDGSEFSVKVEKAEGSTCERCWIITKSVNENGLCDKCQGIVNLLV